MSSTGAPATASVAGSPYSVSVTSAVGSPDPGLTNYVITYVSGQLTVNPAPLTITANGRSKVYGQSVVFAGTEFTPSAMQNGETVGSVSLSSAGAAATAAVSGSPYPITPSAATGGTFTAGNYAITYAPGQLTVNAAALTVTASPQSKTYGQTLTFGSGSAQFTSGGLQNGETIGSVTLAVNSNGGSPTAPVSGSPYTITPSAATGGTFTAGNYAITYATGQLTVNQANTSVSVSSSENPSGFKDSISFTATLPSDATGTVQFKTNATAFGSAKTLAGGVAASDATKLLPRGTNTVTAEYAGDGNYIGSTNNLPGGQVVTNHPPVAAAMAVQRTAGLRLLIALSDVATHWSDVDGDAVTLSGINLVPTNNVNLTTNGAWILYTNSPNVADQISYSINDGFGGTNIGYVTIMVNSSVTGTNSIAKIVTGNPTTLTAYGIPGYSYITERSTDLVTWVDISTNAAAVNGVIIVSDAFSDLGDTSRRPPTTD